MVHGRYPASFKKNIKKPLADEILFGKLAKGGIVQVDVKADEDKLSFLIQAAPPRGSKNIDPDSDHDVGPLGTDDCEQELVE